MFFEWIITCELVCVIVGSICMFIYNFSDVSFNIYIFIKDQEIQMRINTIYIERDIFMNLKVD